MKKVLLTVFAAMAMIAMTACNNNQPAEEATDTTACVAEKQCEHKCMHEGDTTACCKEGAVEGMACEQKCEKAEGQECCKKAEGKECCKKAEGQECEKKCQK